MCGPSASRPSRPSRPRTFPGAGPGNPDLSATLKLSAPAAGGFWEIAILYEDEHLLAVDRPGALPLLPDPANPDAPSLMRLLHDAIAEGKAWTRESNRSWLRPGHRIEASAGGVVVLAKNPATLAALQDWFGAGHPGPRYVVLARGEPREERFEINVPIAPHPVKEGLMRVTPRHGKRARTLCETLERFRGWTLLGCQPLAERPHQVRVHLRHARLPVAGDPQYGGPPLLLSRLKSRYRLKPGREERPLLARPALHAESINLPHPVTGQPLVITAPLPKEFNVALKYLRRFAAPGTADPNDHFSMPNFQFT